MATEVSLEQFRVMMGVFHDAIDVVDWQSKRVSTVLGEVSGTFSAVEHNWQSPAEPTLRDLAAEYRTDAANLNDLLIEILRRMRQSYQNYREVELKAERNLRQQELAPRSHLRLHPGDIGDTPPRSHLRLHPGDIGDTPPRSHLRLHPAPTESTKSELVNLLTLRSEAVEGGPGMPAVPPAD